MLKELVDFFGFWTVVLGGVSVAVGVAVSAVLSAKAGSELGKFSEMMPSEKYSKNLEESRNV